MKSWVRQTYVFGKDLLDNPVVVSSVRQQKDNYLTMIDNLPVLTFRNKVKEIPTLVRDIPGQHTTKKEAEKFHIAVTEGKK